MSRRVALPVLMWSISAAGAEESPADQPIIELPVITVTATKTERSAFTYGVHDQQEATLNGGPSSSFPDADDDIYGFYLEDEITLAERLSVIPGIRYHHYSLDAGTRSESTARAGRNFKVSVSYRF